MVAVLLLVAQAGCVARGPSRPVPKELPWTSSGTIGVIRQDTEARVKAWVPHSAGRGVNEGAQIGAGPGMFLMELAGAEAGKGYLDAALYIGLLGVAFWIVGAFVGAPVGALVGAIKAPPLAAVEEMEREASERVLALNLNGCLAHQTLVALESERAVPLSARAVSAAVGAGDAATRNRDLAAAGVESVLELGAPTLTVNGPFGWNPDGPLVLSVPVRLIRVSDGTAVVRQFRRTATGLFVTWPADASLFDEVVQDTCIALAEEIAEALAGPRASREPGAKPTGNAGDD